MGFGTWSRRRCRLPGLALALTGALAAAACGGSDPTAPLAAGRTAEPTPTPAAAGADAGAPSRWAPATGNGAPPGAPAHNPVLTLRDGSMKTLEEVAGGKPALLYFFETW